MKTINLFALVFGILFISACASNEVAEETGAAEAEMTEKKDAAESEAAATIDEAEAKAAEEKAAVEEQAAEAKAEADAKAEEMEADASAGDSSGNLVSTCSYGDQERIITVVYDNDETDTVCEVTYEKSSGVQTLWTANNDRDYCKERAAEFVEKQEGWGWTCTNLE